MRTQWNDEEDAALLGLPLLARVLYLQGIRRHMDYSTGLVGAKRKISYQSMRETAFVEPGPGRKSAGSPSLKAVRVAIDQLIRAGLVDSTGTDKRLIFLCRMADVEQSAQKKQGSNRADPKRADHGTNYANQNNAFTEQQGSNRADPKTAEQGNPQESGKDSDPKGSGASAGGSPKTAIWNLGEDYLGSRALVGKLCKQYGEAPVFHAIAQTATHAPADPKAYIHGLLKNGANHAKPRHNGSHYRSAAQRGEDYAAEVRAAIEANGGYTAMDG